MNKACGFVGFFFFWCGSELPLQFGAFSYLLRCNVLFQIGTSLLWLTWGGKAYSAALLREKCGSHSLSSAVFYNWGNK